MKKLSFYSFAFLSALPCFSQYYQPTFDQTFYSEPTMNGGGYVRCNFSGVTFTENTNNVFFQDCTFNNVTFAESTLFDDYNGNRFHGDNTFTGNTNFCLDNGYVDLEGSTFSGTVRFKGSTEPDEIGEVASGINLKGADFQNVTNNDIFETKVETKVGTKDVVWKNIDFRNAKFSNTNKPDFTKMEAVIGTDGIIHNLDLSNGGEIELNEGFYEDDDGIYPAATLKDNVVMNGASIYIEEDKLIIDNASLRGVEHSENLIELEVSGKDMPLIEVKNGGTLDFTNIELEIDTHEIINTNRESLAEIVGTKFTIIEWDESSNVYINSEEVEISSHYSFDESQQFNSQDWLFVVDNENRVAFIVAVPEPAEWAMILGMLVLGFAVYRKRK